MVAVDFRTKTTVEGDYFQVTPKGLVPALKLDDGAVLTEGAVILQWIADRKPERKLLPSFGTPARYTALEWLNFVATDLHKGMATLFSPFIDPASKASFAEGNLRSRFGYIEQHLSNNDYVLGQPVLGRGCLSVQHPALAATGQGGYLLLHRYSEIHGAHGAAALRARIFESGRARP